MNLPVKWLKQFINTNDSVQKIAEIFTSIGHEVESYNSTVLNLDITPNRSDCFSILGLAREYAAATNKKLTSQQKPQIPETQTSTLKLKFLKKSICPRYTYRIIEHIKIQPSPKWLQNHLIKYGFRPINNIVDITNFVMIELGQPLHAFDYSKVSGSSMEICLSKKGQSLTTLDGKNCDLPDSAIIIKDANKIIDLAGIMGGYNSEVDNNTQSIVLQAAVFNPTLIRKASKALKHITDASYRYERGVDPQNTTFALDRAVELLLESCPNISVGPIQDIKNEPIKTISIPFNTQKINKFLSTNLSNNQIDKILTSLGFKITKNSILVPSWRIYDVKNIQDIVEEVGRIHGYNKLKRIELSKFKNTKINKQYLSLELLKDKLVARGYTEIIGYPMTADKNPIRIINPVSMENQYLRSTLTESLLRVVSNNPWYADIKSFELGKVYLKKSELYNLAILETSKSTKNIIQNLQTIEKELGSKLDYQEIKVSQNDLDKHKIKKSVSLINVQLPKFNNSIKWESINIPKKRVKYQSISKFPPSTRDLAFIVNTKINALDISFDIQKISTSDAWVVIVEKFDEFEHKKFGQGKKNLAFHVVVDRKKKITENQINSIFSKIIDTIEKKYKAKLREF
ncbi:MAG: phenylalanine--tRNA ligase subunit beta [bacterium]